MWAHGILYYSVLGVRVTINGWEKGFYSSIVVRLPSSGVIGTDILGFWAPNMEHPCLINSRGTCQWPFPWVLRARQPDEYIYGIIKLVCLSSINLIFLPTSFQYFNLHLFSWNAWKYSLAPFIQSLFLINRKYIVRSQSKRPADLQTFSTDNNVCNGSHLNNKLFLRALSQEKHEYCSRAISC